MTSVIEIQRRPVWIFTTPRRSPPSNAHFDQTGQGTGMEVRKPRLEGPTSGCRDTSETLPGLLLATTDLEDVFEHDDTEDLTNPLVAAADGDGAAEASEADEEPDEGADAGTGDNRDVREIENEESSILAGAGRDVIPELGGAVDFEVAG